MRRKKKRQSEGPTFRTKDNPCPHCGTKLNAFSYVKAELKAPTPGDISVCIRCGGLLQFETDFTVKPLEPHILFTLFSTQPDDYARIVAARKIIKDLNQEKTHDQ